MSKMILVLVSWWLLAWLCPAYAQYVMELKNGRRITVQSYREEGSMIKFSGNGGEIGISKDQVKSIRRAGDGKSRKPSALEEDEFPPTTPESTPPLTPKPPGEPAARMPAPQETPEAKRDAEEKAYLQRIEELTRELKQLREQYAIRTRGNTGPEPQFFTTEEAFKGHQADLLSRLRDAQLRARGLPTGSDATSPPLALDAPPAYTEKQKELSDLRRRINQLASERQKLIDEMKAKGFDTGTLFLD